MHQSVSSITTDADTATTRKPEVYTSGLGEQIRAVRQYIGLSQHAMAERVGKDRRDYQRIESGKDDCPPGLLSQLTVLADAFDTQIDAVIYQAKLYFEATSEPMPVSVITDGRAENEWLRLVAGRAYAEERPNAPIELVAFDNVAHHAAVQFANGQEAASDGVSNTV